MSSPSPSSRSVSVQGGDADRPRCSRKHTPDYADECLHLDEPPEPWKEPVSSLALRKGSCETQWDIIKKRFVTWKENGQKNIVKLTVQHDIGIARQIAQSERVLTDLHADGTELIHNVRAANETRELARRRDDDAARAVLLADMRAESEEAGRRVAAITERWSQLEEFKEPMGLFDGLGQQKRRIDELMAQKDGLIEELDAAVRAADRRYQADQETQTGDIATLVDRIDRQVEVMRDAYHQHLEILQRTVDAERLQFKHAEAERWHALYAQRDEAELAAMRGTAELSAEYDAHMAAVERTHAELNRATKVRLERENAALQIELQAVRAEVLLNSEKLTYNYKVLQLRTDENVTVKAQQKRRLNRLNEVVAGLRQRYQTAVQQGSAEVARLTAEVTKLYANVMELDAKAQTFAAVSAQKYGDIWAVHEAECGQLVERFGEIDRCIAERHLGLAVERPKTGASSSEPAKRVRPEFMAKPPPTRSASARSAASSAGAPSAVLSLDAQIVEVILNKIASHTEWLQDDSLDELCFKLDETMPVAAAERLIKIDHVFEALGLNSAEHVQAVMRHFVPNVFCEQCKAAKTATMKPEEVDQRCAQHGHKYVIEESLVIPTLRTYVERFYQRECRSNRRHGRPATAAVVSHTTTGISRQIGAADVSQFWQSFVSEVPAHRNRLWTALEGGMAKYLQVLKKREKLDIECEFLRKQNAELKHLLLRYLPAQNKTSSGSGFDQF